LVNATLMNIADNPTNVQLPGSYDDTPLHRVPIVVTGNDFATLYAPLVRDGRMEKFYWEPSREDKIGIVDGIFSDPADQSGDALAQLSACLHEHQGNYVRIFGIDPAKRRVMETVVQRP
jgi:hypothetical protein